MSRTVCDWWNKKSHVDSYLEMTSDYSGGTFLDRMDTFLPPGSSLLELGMGPGKDLDILAKRYNVTGSDVSEVFLNLYREKHPDVDLVILDAVNPDFGKEPRRFDAVFSNKVLVHLTPDELEESLNRQIDLLNPGGLLCHSLWKGEGEEDFDGLHFCYWSLESLQPLIPLDLETVLSESYTEDEKDDSLLLILRKK